MFTNKSTLERLGPERLIRLLRRPNFEKLLESRLQTPIFVRASTSHGLYCGKNVRNKSLVGQHFYLPNNVCFLDLRWLTDDESVTNRYYRIVTRVLTHRLHLFNVQVSCSLWCFGGISCVRRFVVIIKPLQKPLACVFCLCKRVILVLGSAITQNLYSL